MPRKEKTFCPECGKEKTWVARRCWACFAAHPGNFGAVNPSKRLEVREKISQANLGKVLSEKTRQKMSKSHLGSKHRPETIEKIRVAHLGRACPWARDAWLGRKHSAESRNKMRQAHLGKKMSVEARRKMGLARRGSLNPAYGKSYWLGKRHKLETREKISRSSPFRGRLCPDRSVKVKRVWQTRGLDERRRITLNGREACGTNPSLLETQFLDSVERRAGRRIYRQFEVEGYFFDGRAGKVLLEVDGFYWHSKPGAKARDTRKANAAIGVGFIVLRIPENAIHQNKEETIREAVAFVRENNRKN